MILEAICSGNYSPPDLLSPKDPDYWKANQKVGELMEQLRVQITPSQYKLAEEITAQIYAAQSLENESYYKLGFATGMAIKQEVQEELNQKDLA